METARVAVYSTALLIVVLTLASGPLIGVLEPPQADSTAELGTGNATISVVSFPESVTLDAGQGTNSYYLNVPAATVEATDVRGNPILDYSISIDGMGYSRGSIHLLGDLGNGTHSIVLDRTTLEPDKVGSGEYVGELELTLRGDTERTVFNRTVTVEVRE